MQAPAVRESSAAALRAHGLLRPIVYGLPRSVAGAPAELVASVHSQQDDLVGYLVVDRRGPGPSWASLLTGSGLTVDDACLLARSITSQLGFLSIPHGSAQCLVTAASPPARGAVRRSYLDALLPLIDRGVLRIVVEDGQRGLSPPLARAGLVASAAAAVATALRSRKRRPRRPTVSQHLPTPISEQLVRVLEGNGVCTRADERGGLAAVADVIVVGAPVWSLGPEEAKLVRSGILVALGAVRASLAAEQLLHERGVTFVSDTIASGGRFLTPHLREQGMDPRTAISRTAEIVSGRLTELFESSRGPLAESARSFASGDLRESA